MSKNSCKDFKEISFYKSPEIYMSYSNGSILKRKYLNKNPLRMEKPGNEVYVTNKKNSLDNVKGFYIQESSNLLQILELKSKELIDVYKNNLSNIVNYNSCINNEFCNEKKSCTYNIIRNLSLTTQLGKTIENKKLMILWKDNCIMLKSLLIFPYHIQ
jgi:hypothetical protein